MNRELETQLRQALEKQIEIYEQAITVAEELSRRYDLSQESQVKLGQLTDLMSAAAQHEAATQPLRDEWNKTFDGRTHSITEVKVALKDKINQLIKLTGSIEDRAKQRRNTLSPKFGEQLKAKNAFAAYSRR